MNGTKKNLVIISYNNRYQDSFIEAYKSIFKESPYFEYFNDDEVREVTQTVELFLLPDNENKLLGFVGGIPLKRYYQTHQGEEAKLKSSIDETFNTYYIAELGIITEKRGLGLGTFLFTAFLEIQKNKGYTQFFLDTADLNNFAHSLYEKSGFKKLKDKNNEIVYRDISQLRIDGIIHKEKRPYYIMKIQ